MNKELIQKMQSQFDALARIDSCKTSGYDQDHHFRGVTKMVSIGSGAWAKT